MGIFKKTLIVLASLTLMLSAVGCSGETNSDSKEQKRAGVSESTDSGLISADGDSSPVIYEDTNIRLKNFSLTSDFRGDLLRQAEIEDCLGEDLISEVEDGSGMAFSNIGAFCCVENLTDKSFEFSSNETFVEINGQQVYCTAIPLKRIEPNTESYIFFPFFNCSEVLATDFKYCFDDTIASFMESLGADLRATIEYANFNSLSEIEEFKFSLCYTPYVLTALDDGSYDESMEDMSESRVNIENVDLRFSGGKLGAYQMGENTKGEFKYTEKTNQDILVKIDEAYADWQFEHADEMYQK